MTDEELDKLIQARSAAGFFHAKSAFEVLNSVLGPERAKAIIEANGMKEI